MHRKQEEDDDDNVREESLEKLYTDTLATVNSLQTQLNKTKQKGSQLAGEKRALEKMIEDLNILLQAERQENINSRNIRLEAEAHAIAIDALNKEIQNLKNDLDEKTSYVLDLEKAGRNDRRIHEVLKDKITMLEQRLKDNPKHPVVPVLYTEALESNRDKTFREELNDTYILQSPGG